MNCDIRRRAWETPSIADSASTSKLNDAAARVPLARESGCGDAHRLVSVPAGIRTHMRIRRGDTGDLGVVVGRGDLDDVRPTRLSPSKPHQAEEFAA